MPEMESGGKKARGREKRQKIPVAAILENKLVAAKDYDYLLEHGYGKRMEGGVELSFSEALYLLEKGRVSAKKGVKKLDFGKLLGHCIKLDKRLHERYVVYRDLRERGLLVKTGFKFGSDFRVYSRGVKVVKRGPKTPMEHTKWVVHCVPEDYTCSFQELSRAVRLAHSIRAKMLWAVVDSENDVTYYSIMRELL